MIGVTAIGVTVVLQSAHNTAVCAVVDAAGGCVQCADCYNNSSYNSNCRGSLHVSSMLLLFIGTSEHCSGSVLIEEL
jgi:hypothetical protein